MMGVTLASIGPMLAIDGQTPGSEGARMIYRAIVAAGVIAVIITPLVRRMLRFFPPVLTGTIMLVIGVTLMRIGINWTFGNPVGPTAPQIIGGVLASALGLMHFDIVGAAAWLGIITPFHFGAPIFDLVMIVTMVLVMIVVMIESTGMSLALGDFTGGKVTQPMLTAGLRTDGLGTLIGGIFNTFPYTSFSQNVGLVGVTGIKSRFVCVAGGLILILLALCRRWARWWRLCRPRGGSGRVW